MTKEKDQEHSTTVHNTTHGKNRPENQGKNQCETLHDQHKNMPKKEEQLPRQDSN
jgi:hypothetical protein